MSRNGEGIRTLSMVSKVLQSVQKSEAMSQSKSAYFGANSGALAGSGIDILSFLIPNHENEKF